LSSIEIEDRLEIGLWRTEERKWGNKKIDECKTSLNSEIPCTVIINYLYLAAIPKVYWVK
jgi:hypothetical protein